MCISLLSGDLQIAETDYSINSAQVTQLEMELRSESRHLSSRTFFLIR